MDNDRKFQNTTSVFIDDERRVGLFVEKISTGRRLGFFVGKLFGMGRDDGDSVAILISYKWVTNMNHISQLTVGGAQDTNEIDTHPLLLVKERAT